MLVPFIATTPLPLFLSNTAQSLSDVSILPVMLPPFNTQVPSTDTALPPFALHPLIVPPLIVKFPDADTQTAPPVPLTSQFSITALPAIFKVPYTAITPLPPSLYPFRMIHPFPSVSEAPVSPLLPTLISDCFTAFSAPDRKSRFPS